MGLTDTLAYCTADIPGIGGTLKQRPDDFLVDELPLYEPSGSGEHLMLFVQKRELTTLDLVKRAAKAFRVGKRDVGYAGLKDKHGVTRQHLTIWLPGVDNATCAAGLERFTKGKRLEVLWAERHQNKIKRGHHGGNRFVITLRDVQPHHVIRAKQVLDRLAKTGFPNYLGDQRFGYRDNGHTLGRYLLTEKWDELLHELLAADHPDDVEELREARAIYRGGDMLAAMNRWPKSLPYDRQALDALRQGFGGVDVVKRIELSQRRLMLSAWQSAVFNNVLDARVRDGTWDRLVPGDLAWKHDNRAVFAVDPDTAELENGEDGRAPKVEVSPSGPMWGTEMTRAAGAIDALERRMLDAGGLTEGQLIGPAAMPELSLEGLRRPLREPLLNPSVEAGSDEHGPYIKAAFQLGRGTYATVALREVMKPGMPQDAPLNAPSG